MSKRKKSAYAQAGVDIDEMMSGLKDIKKMVKGTATKGVLSDIGSFGGLFSAPGKDSVLVASTDGVGTKLKVAAMAKRHDTVGQDLINHCVNDILVQGARPLFFMDYLGTARLKGGVFKDVVKGLCKACRENNCAMLGGETAEMPGLYPPGEYDLVGTIVGVVEKKKIITGKSIKPNDLIIGLPATGLQTNGYSLARKVIFEKMKLKIKSRFPGTKKTVADILLDVHKSALKPVSAVMKKVKIQGMAHITGGGIIDNVPRSLPAGTKAVFETNTWKVPHVFNVIEEQGKVDHEEMFRVFNMGIGFVVIVRARDANATINIMHKNNCRGAKIIGHIEKGSKCAELRH